jgi:hypothetical protein
MEAVHGKEKSGAEFLRVKLQLNGSTSELSPPRRGRVIGRLAEIPPLHGPENQPPS